ncbi:MAG TPA: hypothetical protein VMH01_02245 [Puia sp.]|nr:hypothetical protein [Puia sp.]
MKTLLKYLIILKRFMQIYFCVLGFFVFLMIIDKSIDLKQQVFTKNLLFYIVLTVLIFLSGTIIQNISQNANA